MLYNIKVTHTSPTFTQFAEWGVQRAFPTFYLNIIFYNKENDIEELSFKIKIEGNYYCCGSRNFEDIKMKLDSYKILNNMSKEEISKLLEDDNIIKLVSESIKGSMIPNDPIRILELLWDNF